jgi:hypothetical protein
MSFMPRRLNVILAAILLPTAARSARGEDPLKIVGEYVKAVGGSKALSRVQTLTLEGTFSSPADDGSGTYTLLTRLPNRYYSELGLGDRTIIQAYNGKSAWIQNGTEGPSTLVGPEGLQLEVAGQYYNSRLVDPKKNKIGVAFVGHAQVRGKDAVHLEITTSAGIKRQIFFDVETHLIVRESATVGGVDEDRLYDDYRTVAGVKLPHTIDLQRGSESYHILVTRAATNAPINDGAFDFPKRSQIQLPDLKTLFAEIDDNQKAIDTIKEDYAGSRAEEETEYESDGRIKKRELREYTFFYLDGDEISTLVKKAGKPLSDAEQKKENESVQKAIREHRKRQAQKKAKEEGKGDKGDDPGIETFLRASRFLNPRRERFRGQDVLVFDFEPNPDFKARKLEEKVVQRLAGVIWIDEKAHDVARLEAYFVDDFKMAGGLLAKLQKGTTFVFEQGFVNGEVWLPTYFEAHIGARFLLIKGVKINMVTRYSDYKKFDVETVSSVVKP